MLKIWRRQNQHSRLFLDTAPTGQAEDELLFGRELHSPEDLNAQILAERQQDMGERVLYADRAFLVTLTWVIFLVFLTFAQMLFSIWDNGLTNAQFITVVTTTTASILGFWLLVGQYLHKK